jgi:hypothetical protein
VEADVEERRLAAATRLLKRAEGFQHQDAAYVALLEDDSALVRLEVLSFALDDAIRLPEENLRQILAGGTPLERRYALLVLARNGQTSTSEIDETDIGSDEDVRLWKLACHYAASPSMSGMLSLFHFTLSDDVSRANLAINLCTTAANAPHRILLYDLLKIAIGSGIADENMGRVMADALKRLSVRSSWRAVRNYTFGKEELSRLLS